MIRVDISVDIVCSNFDGGCDGESSVVLVFCDDSGFDVYVMKNGNGGGGVFFDSICEVKVVCVLVINGDENVGSFSGGDSLSFGGVFGGC